MVCEQIPASEFHSDKYKTLTRTAVRQLQSSRSLGEYADFVQRHEQLFYASIISPLMLFVVFYADMICGVMSGFSFHDFTGSTLLSVSPMVAGVLWLIMQMLVVPYSILAPFCGMFRTVDVSEGRLLFFLFWLLHMTCSESVVPSSAPLWLRMMSSVIPQGGLLCAYSVFCWRNLYWKRSFDIPLALLTVPILICGLSFAWERYTTAAVASTVATIVGNSNHLGYGSLTLELLMSSIEGVRAQAVSDVLVAVQLLFNPTSFLDQMIPSSATLTRSWTRGFGYSCVYFVASLLSAPLWSLAEWIDDTILPKHPTTILVSATVIVVVMLFSSAVLSPIVAFLGIGSIYALLATVWEAE